MKMPARNNNTTNVNICQHSPTRTLNSQHGNNCNQQAMGLFPSQCNNLKQVAFTPLKRCIILYQANDSDALQTVK